MELKYLLIWNIKTYFKTVLEIGQIWGFGQSNFLTVYVLVNSSQKISKISRLTYFVSKSPLFQISQAFCCYCCRVLQTVEIKMVQICAGQTVLFIRNLTKTLNILVGDTVNEIMQEIVFNWVLLSFALRGQPYIQTA